MSEKKNTSNSRRDFIKKSALGAAALTMGGLGLSTTSYSRIMGANDRVNIAFVGCFRRFDAVLSSLPGLKPHLKLAYVCDVDKIRLDRAVLRVSERMGEKPEKEEDLRKILEDKNVDAIINATPDHWHAPGTWMALQAGKHVYVEKPCSHNPREGELLVDFQKKYGKVVQMGNQQRSSVESQEIIQEIHNGIIGKAYKGVAFYSNNRGAIPLPAKATPPPSLNWDLFQGPAPRGEYMNLYFDYNWHWYWQFGTAETGNNATHELDICRWALQVEHPSQVFVDAGKHHFLNDGWGVYDTMDATFQYEGGKTIQWDGKSRTNFKTYGTDRGSIIYGSEGTVFINRDGYKLYDRDGKLLRERKMDGQNQSTELGGAGSLDGLHMLNFIDTIRGKAKAQHSPIAEGAKSTLLCHLANIGYRTGEILKTDPKTGRITNSKEAMKLWSRQYEKGWEPKL
jgi:predicted dehydrogenase